VEAVRSEGIKIVRLPFLVPRWAAAQVLLPRRVFVRRGARLGRRLLAHELVHVDQLRTLGLMRYWLVYLALLARHGYREHPFELDATVRSAEPRFLDWAASILAESSESNPPVRRGRPSGRPFDLH
jgi:hypothetical protein